MDNVYLTAGSLGTPSIVNEVDCRTTGRHEAGTIFYGPHREQAAGRHAARFRLGLADTVPPIGDSICARIDVVTNNGMSQLVERFVLYSELESGLATFELAFELHEARSLEYRVFGMGQVALNIAGQVEIETFGNAAPSRSARGSKQRAWENEREFLDGYLRNISGVIHVGANIGQERRYYWLIGVDVLWVEPIREVYDKLVDNIARYPRQKPILALLGAQDGEEVTLGIANNGGASSSMLPLEDHRVLFPDIEYLEQRRLTTVTLGTMIERHNIDLSNYQALTLDTEGAELMILTGAGDLLKRFEYIKCEVADFPARTGTPSTENLDNLLTALGFQQLARRPFSMGPDNAGTYWDIVWKRCEANEPLHEPGFPLPFVMNAAEVDAVEKCE